MVNTDLTLGYAFRFDVHPNLMRSPIPTSLGSLALVAVGLVLFGSSNLLAGASNKNGNPFGNGTFFQTTGTFSSVIRGQNLSGTMLFSTGASTNFANTNSSGSCVISYLGSPDGTIQPGVYRGNAAGMWDPSSGTISGQFWGSYLKSGTNSFTNWSQAYNTNVITKVLPDGSTTNVYEFPVIVNIVSNVVIPPTAGSISNGIVIPGAPGTNYTVTNTLYLEPYGANSYNDAAMMNGSFDGYVQNKYPNQTFTAQGSIAQQALAQQQQGYNAFTTNADGSSTNYNQEGTLPIQMALASNIPVTLQGLRISDAYSDFSTISNSIPYAMTTYGVTNVPSQQGGW
jgi:hypothetical protein